MLQSPRAFSPHGVGYRVIQSAYNVAVEIFGIEIPACVVICSKLLQHGPRVSILPDSHRDIYCAYFPRRQLRGARATLWNRSNRTRDPLLHPVRIRACRVPPRRSPDASACRFWKDVEISCGKNWRTPREVKIIDLLFVEHNLINDLINSRRARGTWKLNVTSSDYVIWCHSSIHASSYISYR